MSPPTARPTAFRAPRGLRRCDLGTLKHFATSITREGEPALGPHSGSIVAERPTLRALLRESRLLGWVGSGDGQPQMSVARARRRLAPAPVSARLAGAATLGGK